MIYRFTRSLMGKLVVFFVSGAMAPIAVLGYLSYTSAKRALEASEFEKLDSMRDTQARYVQNYITETLGQLRLLLKRQNLKAALISLSWSYEDEERTAGTQAKPGEASSVNQPTKFGSEASYDTVHKNFSAFLEVQTSADGYEDMIYVNASDGRVIYTNKHLSDFGADLKTGLLRESGLGRVYETVMSTGKPALVTFELYGPAGGPACFIAAPVKVDDANRITGVLAIRLSANKISEMMRLSQSAGKTAEACVVDQDTLMLSDSRFKSESTVLKQRVDTVSARLALEGKTGHMVSTNYKGDAVFSSYTLVPLNEIKDFVPNVKWALIAEIGEVQALQPATELGRRIVGMAVVVSVIMALLGVLLARTVSRPVSELAAKMAEVSGGDLVVEIPMQQRNDELGNLARSIAAMVENLRNQIRKTVEGITILATSSNEISATISQLATSTARTSSAVAETTTTVEQVRHAARLASEQARKVAEGAHQSVMASEGGQKATEDTILRMNLIKEQMESIAATVVRLSEQSQTIEDIIVTVQDLASTFAVGSWLKRLGNMSD